MSKPFVLQVVGYKNSGKTTLVCMLVDACKRAGLRVGTVKHDGHDFDMDVPGTDTWKHRKAGADMVAITSAHQTAMVENGPASLQELAARMTSADVILAEGFKSEPYPKIVLLKEPADLELLERVSGTVAVISWFSRGAGMSAPAENLPWLHIDDTGEAERLLLDIVLRGRSLEGGGGEENGQQGARSSSEGNAAPAAGPDFFHGTALEDELTPPTRGTVPIAGSFSLHSTDLPDGLTPSIHGIVLAGGRSSRMGTDKALLPAGGRPLIRLLCDQLLGVCEEVIVVVADLRDNKYKDALAGLAGRVCFAADEHPGKGPLAGIHAGLSAIPDGYGFIMACDMPQLSVPLFREMAGKLDGRVEAVMCEGEPFHAFYHRRAALKADMFLRDNRLRLQSFCNALETIEVAPDTSGCFRNLNTPEEFVEYARSQSGERDGAGD